MPINRARRQLLAASAAAGLVRTIPAAQIGQLSFAPAAFDAHADRVTLWASASEEMRLLARWRIAGEAAWRDGPALKLDASNDTTGAVTLRDLPAGATLEYQFVHADSRASASGVSRCNTAQQGVGKTFRFAFSADLEEAYKPFSIFDSIAEAKPDFALLLGDTIYADHPKREFSATTPHYRRKYARNRSDTSFQNFLSQHTTYTIWDDHEIENDCHGGHPAIALAQKVYREYWPCESVTSDGLYRSFAWGGARFIILDTRSFRSPHAQADDAQKSMLGAKQKVWLFSELKKQNAAFTFIITSVPFQGGGQDTWASYKTERMEIEAYLKREKLSGVVFLTGDYHLARDWSRPEAGYHEFMAGPLASFTMYGREPAARARYEKSGTFHYGDGANFALIDVDCASGRLKIEWRDARGHPLGSREVKLTSR
jgi:alkaline phosphatase D